MSSHSVSGAGGQYERYLAHNEQSTLHKMKETYWNTKQAVMRKIGKKEDAHIVASDAQLDAKLEVFRAIQKSCMDLLRAIERYQDRLCALSQEENSMGRFLKTHSQQDKTRAGKMMAAVGKSQSFSSQQRLALRVPLVRLYQEVETFRYRAISDTLVTINKMESARTEYRAALLWMKDVSEVLDPDTYKQMEKFRKVQAQVKKTKARFDKLKLDTMQKIDLLAASRCNMFSHVLANYQSTLLVFWDKTSRTMSAVSESFKGYQYYEFNMLKDLVEPSKKLAEETGGAELEGGESDKEGRDPSPEPSKSTKPRASHQCSKCRDKNANSQKSPNDKHSSPKPCSEHDSKNEDQQKLLSDSSKGGDMSTFTGDTAAGRGTASGDQGTGDVGLLSSSPGHGDSLISLDDKNNEEDNASLNNLLEDVDREINRPVAGESENFLDFGIEAEEDQDIETLKRKQDEEFDLAGKFLTAKSSQKNKNTSSDKDLLCDDLEPDETDRDDMALLNEILNTPSAGDDEFTKEWQSVFGNSQPNQQTSQAAPSLEQTDDSQFFMPSDLLDMSTQMSAMDINQGDMMGGMMPSMMMPPQQSMQQPFNPQQPPQQQPQQQTAKPKPAAQGKKGQSKDMSAWFNLFADLDPLSNPDAIGRKTEDMTDA